MTGQELSQFDKAVAVNGQVEFEEGWSFWGKIFAHVYFRLCRIETFFIFWPNYICLWLYRIFFKKIILKKKVKNIDVRRIPVSQIFYTPGKAVLYLKHNATTWRAIEFIYTWKEQIIKLSGLQGLISRYLGQVENIKATRNRLRLVKQRMYRQIERMIEQDSPSIIISEIAAGSARGSIEVVASFLIRNPSLINRFKIHFVDADSEAKTFALRLARETFPGLEKCIVFKQMKISSKEKGQAALRAYLAEINPDIVGMVGFGDYMKDAKAETIYSIIYECLADNGILLTNNVKPNHEQRFLETVVTWKMINRTEEQTRKVLAASGFQDVTTYNEPCNIQPVYEARKAA